MDSVKPLSPDELPPLPEKPKKAVIEITLTFGEGLQVKAPFEDKLLCYGMLECARDEVDRWWRDYEAKLEAAEREKAAGSRRTPGGLIVPR